MIFELPLRDTYIPEWGIWESLREAIQNGLDEHDRGSPLTIKHTGEYLRIFNLGANIDVKALLIGHTDKRGNDNMRGNQGEGLDLCFLAGVRSGLDIKVLTPTEIWIPYLEFSDNYGVPILKVKTRKNRKPFNGVEVQINIDKNAWEDSRKLFTSLRDEVDDDLKVKTTRGTVYFDPDSRGTLFVKGIFVQKRPDLTCGFDLNNIQLDRDRRVVNDWDLKYELAYIFKQAILTHPDKAGKRIYRLIQAGAEDTRGMGSYGSLIAEAGENIADYFLEEFGEDAVPVESIADSEELEHSGKKGVVVSDTLRKILAESKVDSVKSVRENRETEIKNRFSWTDLTEDEQRVLKTAGKEVESAIEWATPARCEALFLTAVWESADADILSSIQIVEFYSDVLEGVANINKRSIKISRNALSHVSRTIRVLVHEKAHILAGTSDNIHGRFTEELWTLVHASKF